MKLLVVFASVVLAINATSDQDQWLQFKTQHGKTYRSMGEEKLRFAIFQDNLRRIAVHNVKFDSGAESYTMGVNQFADITAEEFRARLITYKKPTNLNASLYVPSPGFKAPANFDWRIPNVVLSVKNQGSCGSCWAFAVDAALEGQNAVKNGIRIDLSAQQLVDCSTSYGNEACTQGAIQYAVDYIKDHGIESWEEYPYTGTEGTCNARASSSVIFKVTGYESIEQDETVLQVATAEVGPIATGINADLLQLYSSGIFNDASCSGTIDHFVLIVGYGTENNQDYWIVKNSWGDGWGEQGYARMARNANFQCALGTDSIYPTIF